MRRYLEEQGVPRCAIVEDEFGWDTYDTCVRARRVFRVRSAVLISQRYHLPRAVATARAIGLDAVGVGDVSVRQTSRRWNEFARREVAANLKLALDLVSRRVPSRVGDPCAVRAALAGSADQCPVTGQQGGAEDGDRCVVGELDDALGQVQRSEKG